MMRKVNRNVLQSLLVVFALAAGLRLAAGGVEYPMAGNLNLKSGTVEMWFYPMKDMYTPIEGSYQTVFTFFEFGIPGNFKAAASWYKQSENRVRVKVSMSSPLLKKGVLPLLGTAPEGWKEGELHHLAMVWDLTNMEYYFDGRKVSSRKQLIELSGEPGKEKIVFGNGKRGANNYVLRGVRISSVARRPEKEGEVPELKPDASTLLFDDFSKVDLANKTTSPRVIADMGDGGNHGTLLGGDCRMTDNGLALFPAPKKAKSDSKE